MDLGVIAMKNAPHSSISKTGTSPSDCLMSYSRHLLQGSDSSAQMLSRYFTVPADWALWINRQFDVVIANLVCIIISIVSFI